MVDLQLDLRQKREPESLGDIIGRFSVSSNDLQQECHDRFFVLFSKELGSFEKGLAILLGLKQNDIEEIEKSQKSQEEQVISMFWKWREIQGSKATYLLLLEALYEHDNINGVESALERLQEELTKGSQEIHYNQLSVNSGYINDHSSVKRHSNNDHQPVRRYGNNVHSSVRRYSNDDHRLVRRYRSDDSLRYSNDDHRKYRSNHSSVRKNSDDLSSVRYSCPVAVKSYMYNRSASIGPISYNPKSEFKGAKQPNNLAWKIMDKHYNEIVKILCRSDDLCKKSLHLFCDYFVIEKCEMINIEQLSLRKIKSKAIVEQVSIFLSGARNHDRVLSKIIFVLNKIEEMKKIVEQIEIEASRCINLKTQYYIRESSGEPLKTIKSQTPTAQCKTADDNEDITTPTIKKYSRVIKNLYQKWKPDPKWSPVDASVKIYVDLAVIENGNEPCRDSFSKSTIRGTVDDITQQKKPLSFNELCNNIPHGSTVLIDGAPGIGKSMLAYEMCSQWLKGENLNDYTLLLLLRLRDKNIQSLSTVEELLGCFLERQSWKPDVIQDIFDNSGEGVMVIFEGFDELPEHLTETNSPFFALVHQLPLASTVFTSRPSARHCLTQNLKFSFQVEVLGFTQDSIEKYTQEFFRENQDQIDHFKYCLNKSPRVASCLYIPINLAIICTIFAKEHFLPIEGDVTSTKLYEALIKMLLYRHIKSKNPDSLLCIENLSNLPDAIQRDFFDLCKMAYHGIKSKDTKLSFTVLDPLGLMQREVQVLPGYGDTPIYSFLHLTIQEFLAAFYISKQPNRVIQANLNKYKHVQKFFTTICFLAGLTKLEGFTLIIPSKIYSLDIFQFLSESENDDMTKRLFSQPNEYTICRVLPVPTPHDMFSLGRCVALSKCKWKFGFTRRGMRLEHMKEFQKGLSSVPSSASEIRKIGFSLNAIGNQGLHCLLHIPEHFLKRLCFLFLISADLDKQCLDELVDHLPRLTQLTKFLFHNNNFKEGEQVALIELLASLPLSYVSFSMLSSIECQKLLTNVNSLKEIELHQLSSLSIEAVFQHLPYSVSLQVLHIKQSECSTDIIVHHLPRALAKCHQLKAIEFVNCAIDSSSIPAIIEAVQNAPQITSVGLENNYINYEGGLALCGMIHEMRLSSRTFTELDVRHNPFTEETVHRFIEELLQWTTPFTLYLSQEWESFKQHEKFIKFQKYKE